MRTSTSLIWVLPLFLFCHCNSNTLPTNLDSIADEICGVATAKSGNEVRSVGCETQVATAVRASHDQGKHKLKIFPIAGEAGFLTIRAMPLPSNKGVVLIGMLESALHRHFMVVVNAKGEPENGRMVEIGPPACRLDGITSPTRYLSSDAYAVDSQGRVLRYCTVKNTSAGTVQELHASRYYTDGTVDSSFAPPPGQEYMTTLPASAELVDASIDSNGRHVLGMTDRIVRMNPDGLVDSFGRVWDTNVIKFNRLSLFPSGQFLGLAGIAFGPSKGAFSLTRLNSDTSLDTDFGSTALYSDFGAQPGYFPYMEWNQTSFITAPNSDRFLHVLSDGRILFQSYWPLGARVNATLGTDRVHLIMLKPNGKLDDSFGVGGTLVLDREEERNRFNATVTNIKSVLELKNGDLLLALEGSLKDGTGSCNNPEHPAWTWTDNDLMFLRVSSSGAYDKAAKNGGIITIDLGGNDQMVEVFQMTNRKILAVGRSNSFGSCPPPGK